MFRITVKDKNSEWTEDYSSTEWKVVNQSQAESVGKSFIDKFNRTLRQGENPRTLVKAEYLGEDTEENQIEIEHLNRRREVMPDYDKKLNDWLS